MPLIKPRTRGKEIVRYIAKLESENVESLHAYAQFLGESPDYVLNQVIDRVLVKDKEFARWRRDHMQSFVPTPKPPRSRSRSRSGGRRSATNASASSDVPHVRPS